MRPRIERSMRVDVYEDGTSRIEARGRQIPGQPPLRYHDDLIPADQVPTITAEFVADSQSLRTRQSGKHERQPRFARTPNSTRTPQETRTPRDRPTRTPKN